jgi:hypothetical protein
MLLAGSLAGSIVIPAALTQAAQNDKKPGAAPPAISSPAPAPAPALIPLDTRSPRAALMYRLRWGIEDMKVQVTASGSMIRFSYRVVEENKAKALNDDKQTPYLIDMGSGARLGVPHTEKIGKLRQVATPKNGREYWMVFSNQGGFVRPGNKVSVVIGRFRADGLVVEALPSARPTQKP